MKKLAFSLWLATVLLIPVQITLMVAARHIRVTGGFGFPGFTSVLCFVFASVGVLIARNQSRNPIGWIFLAVALTFEAHGIGLEYAINGILGRTAPWPFAIVGAWANSWMWFPCVLVVGTVVFQIFPQGTVISRGWRRLLWVTLAVLAMSWVGGTVPGPLENFPARQNPFAIRALAPVFDIEFMAANLLIIASAISLVVRYRRAGRTEREQIKWLAYAAVVAGVTIPFGDFFGGNIRIVDSLIVLSILFIPLAIGIAVLRYRLYDIDRLISRTVSYAVVSAVFGGSFALTVLAIPPAIGVNNQTPGWLIAVATLGVAALFQPVRRRVQHVVDRRFNRARYNAAATIDAFAVRLRDEIDIDALRTELSDVIRRTMQPNHVGLWLKG